MWEKKEEQWTKEDKLEGHEGDVLCIAYSPLKDDNCNWMASGDMDGLIIVWQYKDQKYTSARQIQESSYIFTVAFHPTLHQI